MVIDFGGSGQYRNRHHPPSRLPARGRAAACKTTRPSCINPPKPLSCPHERTDTIARPLLQEAALRPGAGPEYLQAFLPAQVLRLLVLDTLRPEKGSFVSDQLEEAFSDMIFSVRTLAGQYVNICFLLEHKSTPDKAAVFQVLHYISSAMLKQAQDGKPPQLIIPILFYHGEQEWAYRPLAGFFEGLDEALRPYLPVFEYIYNDIQALPDEALLAMLHSRLLQSALLTMKHYFDPAYLEENAVLILAGGRDEQGNFFMPLLVYLFDKVKANSKTVIEIIEKLPEGVKSEVMSALDILIEEGIKIGEQGKAEAEARAKEEKTYQACCNLIKLGADNEFICRALEVDEAYVERVREELLQDQGDEKNG